MLAHLKTILYVVLQRYIWSVISENIALGKTCYQRSRQLLNLAKLVLLVVGPERGVGVLTGDLQADVTFSIFHWIFSVPCAP